MIPDSSKPAQPNPYSATHEELQPAAWPGNRGWIVAMLVLGTLILVSAIVVTAVLAFVAGGIVGQEQLYHSRAADQATQMQSYLNRQGERYAEVTIERASDGWSYLTGTVDSQQDFDQLRGEMQRLFGEELGADMTANVELRESAATRSPEGE